MDLNYKIHLYTNKLFWFNADFVGVYGAIPNALKCNLTVDRVLRKSHPANLGRLSQSSISLRAAAAGYITKCGADVIVLMAYPFPNKFKG